MDSESMVTKYYRMLTLSPGKFSTSAAFLVTTLLIRTIFTSIFSDIMSYCEAALLYTVESLVIMILLTPLKYSRMFNLRRSANFAAALMLLTLPAEVVLGRVGGLRGLGISASSGIALFVLIAFYEPTIAVPTSLGISILPPLLGYSALGHGLASLKLVLDTLHVSVASICLSSLTISIIEYFGRRKGVSPLNSLRAFMKAWLAGEQELLEDIISNMGVSERVTVKSMVLKRESGEPVVLVFPDFHFGPFRSVGSARFPYYLEESLEPGVEALVFHTPCSHERNIATSSKSYEIAKAVASSISSYHQQVVGFKLCRPMVIKKGEWEMYVLRGPTAVVSFLTNIAKGNDDLPYTVWRRVEELGRKAELNLAAVVDTHSLKGPPVKDAGELHQLLDLLEDSWRCSEEDFYVGYGEAEGTGCREVCYDKVKALTLRFGDDRYVLVYLYGNNVDPRTRERITTLLRGLGYNEPLVVTPDDHSCAASFKERPYYVISDCPRLYDAVIEAVERAVESESKATYVTLEHVFHEVRLSGQNIWKLAAMIDELGKLAIWALIATVTLANALPTLMILSS